MKEKNKCGKRRTKDTPYEVWEGKGFEYRVLKKYQTPTKEIFNPHARWLVAVKSPFTYGGWDMGDEYVQSIKNETIKTFDETKDGAFKK